MKKINRKEISILFLILLIAAFLRFWQLAKVPASPDWDEAALGYNAYSLLKTGKDEYGKSWPLILRSFDDYKPAIYAYLAILPIKFFGLNLWAVRLPSAIIGILAVLLTYYLVNELFISELKKDNKPVNSLTRNKLIALTASFLLAISPWHLQFSRAAFESATGMFFDILVAWLFLKSLKNPKYLVLAAFLAGLNIYVYQAEKIFTPLLVLTMFLIWRKQLFRLPRKFLFTALLVGFLTVLPFLKLALTTPEIFLRAKGTSFAADQTVFLSRTVQKLIRDINCNDTLGLILDNRRITYGLSFLSGYLSHFDFNWLFISGDDARHHAPGMGLMYLVELPFFLYGIYRLIFEKELFKEKLFFFFWFLIAPFPAAFTSGVPHAVRALRFLPVIQIFTAIGVFDFYELIKKRSVFLKFLIVIFIFLFFIFNFIYYLNQYFIQLNYFTSQSWQYGYEQAVAEIKKIEPRYEKIIVSNQPHLDQSYMFFLFYLRYDPIKYQQEGGTVSGGFAEERNAFGKYVFRPIEWSKEEKSEKILYVGRPEDFPGEKPVVKTIYFLNGEPAIKIVSGK